MFRPGQAGSLLLIILMLNACSGVDTRLSHAFRSAAMDPVTLVPLAGSLIFSVGDLDEEVSEWAADNNPVYGSKDHAKSWSDGMTLGLVATTGVTALLSPCAVRNNGDCTFGTYSRFIENTIAMVTNEAVTLAAKETFDRDRPSGEDSKSFWSGHASNSFSAAQLSARNIQLMASLDENDKRPRIWLTTVAGATAWARVEAEKHYPSDVLFGAAAGNFISLLIQNYFDASGRLSSSHMVAVMPNPDGLFLQLRTNF